MTHIRLIGLAGRKGAGKTTVANMLFDHFDSLRSPWLIVSFADAIRECCSIIWGLRCDQLSDPKLKEIVVPAMGKSPRQLMQLLGTEVVRSIDEDAWVRCLMRQIDRDPEANFIISDVRMPNEYEAIKAFGGVIWWINRLGKYKHDDHKSENSISPATHHFDAIIENDGTIEAVKARVLDEARNLNVNRRKCGTTTKG